MLKFLPTDYQTHICLSPSSASHTVVHEKYIENYSYNLAAILGEGSYSQVFKGIDTRTNSEVAIKVIDRKKVSSPYVYKMIQQETAIMSHLNHENIVKLHNVVNSINNIYIIQEFCEKGDIDHPNHKFSEKEVIKIVKDLLKALKELELNNIMHRDIKPANIFLSRGVYKLGDFGFARQNESTIEPIETFLVGTPLYMSPQCLQGLPYTQKTDMWSLGITVYELLMGEVPWPCESTQALLYCIFQRKLQFPKSMDKDLQKFIERCLVIDEDIRLGLEEAMDIKKRWDIKEENEKLNNNKVEEKRNNLKILEEEEKEVKLIKKPNFSNSTKDSANDNNNNQNNNPSNDNHAKENNNDIKDITPEKKNLSSSPRTTNNLPNPFLKITITGENPEPNKIFLQNKQLDPSPSPARKNLFNPFIQTSNTKDSPKFNFKITKEISTPTLILEVNDQAPRKHKHANSFWEANLYKDDIIEERLSEVKETKEEKNHMKIYHDLFNGHLNYAKFLIALKEQVKMNVNYMYETDTIKMKLLLNKCQTNHLKKLLFLFRDQKNEFFLKKWDEFIQTENFKRFYKEFNELYLMGLSDFKEIVRSLHEKKDLLREIINDEKVYKVVLGEYSFNESFYVVVLNELKKLVRGINHVCYKSLITRGSCNKNQMKLLMMFVKFHESLVMFQRNKGETPKKMENFKYEYLAENLTKEYYFEVFRPIIFDINI